MIDPVGGPLAEVAVRAVAEALGTVAAGTTVGKVVLDMGSEGA